MLLTRYVMRELRAQLFGVFGVVLTIFLVRRFGALLQEAAEGSIGLLITLELLGLRTIMALPSLLPAALYASVLLGLLRLSMERESTAMLACGVSPGRVQWSVGLFSLIVALGIGLLGSSVRPWAATRYDALRREAAAGLELGSLLPGRFYELSASSEYVVFAQSRAQGKRGYLSDVFLQQRDGKNMAVLYAREAVEFRDEANGYRFLKLMGGNRYDFREGKRDYESTRFDELVIRTALSPMVSSEPREETLPTGALWETATPKALAEVQWRFAMPVAAVILGLFAIPLGRTDPRRGRSFNLFIAILVYVVYRSVLGVAKNWVEDGDLAATPGIWLVHGIALAAAVPALVREWRT